MEGLKRKKVDGVVYERHPGGGLVALTELVHDGAWVSDNARFWGYKWVSDHAWVYGNAQVRGNACAMRNVINLSAEPYSVTITDNHITIGCETFLIRGWRKTGRALARKHGLSKTIARAYEQVIDGLLRARSKLSGKSCK